MSKPITLYGHASGPNPWKVAIILEELKIPYELKLIDMGDMKKEPYVSVNPNGRVPAITDPNTGITLWESGAIIEYLVETYDKSNTLTFPQFPEKYQVKQWLHFQMSGQGPYFGQAVWFEKYHPEKIPSAQNRYKDQVTRVIGVLDKYLQGKQYLVGNKCTIADLAFVTWDMMVSWLYEGQDLQLEKTYPNWAAWNQRLMERPAVKKIVQDKQKAMSGH